MPLAITLTDRGDGTGFDYAVTGFGAGPVRVTVGRDGTGQPDWFTTASQSVSPGDTIKAGPSPGGPLSPGLYWAYAADGDPPAAVTRPARVRVTDGGVAPPTRYRAAIRDAITGWGLPGLAGGVYEMAVPHDQFFTSPCLVLSADGLTEKKLRSASGQDLIAYPTRVNVVSRNEDVAGQAWLPRAEAWRYAVERGFDGSLLGGCPDVIRCETEFAPIVTPNPTLFQHFATDVVVWVKAWQPRAV